eukprot:TRINITY_DN6520_c2_g1_i1.p1 TRINITY_DN6520_c2_g1~~TRINITY_DN6520_c2_g1_i1.p1  ORF type:complete len:314 (+),score=65.87 TRINITY_DN6520_c2_g1_i1:90-944(+)
MDSPLAATVSMFAQQLSTSGRAAVLQLVHAEGHRGLSTAAALLGALQFFEEHDLAAGAVDGLLMQTSPAPATLQIAPQQQPPPPPKRAQLVRVMPASGKGGSPPARSTPGGPPRQIPMATGPAYGAPKRDREGATKVMLPPGYHPEPEDWICAACSNFNYSRRPTCHKCKAQRSAECASALQAGLCPAPAGRQPEAMWVCACGMSNDNAAFVCCSCSAPWAPPPSGTKEMPGANPGDWTCAVCSNTNWARRTACHRCKAPRPDEDVPEAEEDDTEPLAKHHKAH